MTLPYALRLLMLCLASFFVVNAVASLAVGLFSRKLIPLAEGMLPRSGANLLFAVRILPALLGLLTVVFLCVPSYLWLEPDAADEKVGVEGVVTALLGAALLAESIRRAARLINRSSNYTRACSRMGSAVQMGREAGVVILDGETPLLGMAGLVRPRVVISRGVLAALSPRELAAALRHERVHRAAMDNWKRLLMLAAPGVLPFVSARRSLETAWSRITEWAADDEACAGSPRVALSLASALVRVAALGNEAPAHMLMTGLLADRDGLAVRVERLLDPSPSQLTPSGVNRRAIGAVLVMGVAVAVYSVQNPTIMRAVHFVLEQLTD